MSQARKPTAGKGKPLAAKNKKASTAAAAALDDDVSDVPAKASSIAWSRRPALTWKFVQYLQDFPTERVKLFSDTVSDAQNEQRKKQVAKDSKTAQYDKIAKFIFQDDDVEAEGYAHNSKRYSASTKQHVQRLKTAYREHCKTLGQTGSGVPPEEVALGSPLDNQITIIKKTFPWWDDLHAFWRELPNYNPCGVSTSNDGSDHAATAAALYQAGSGQDSDDNADADADADPDIDGHADNDGASPGHNKTVDAEDFFQEEQQEVDNDPLADTDDVSDNQTQLPSTTAARHSRSLSAPSAGDFLARKGQSKTVAQARSGSARPDVVARPSTPAPTAGKLKQKIAGIPRNPVLKGRKNVLDGLTEARLADTERLSKKRGYDHTESMTKLANDRDSKRIKLESEERRLREARAHEARENDKQRAHALQLKQFDLQIALATAGRPAVGAAIAQMPPLAGPAPPATAAAQFGGFGLANNILDLDDEPQVLSDLPLDFGAPLLPNTGFF